MALRKALAYSKRTARPYTRKSKRKGKAYIKTVPNSKIAKFNLGNQKDYENGKHKYTVKLLADEDIQIRDNALESGRMLVNKTLEENIPGQYFMVVKVHPHHMLRDNKTAAGAGADRLSSGMSHSFGIVIGRAAFVRKGQQIFFVSCTDERAAQVVKTALITIKAKVPCRTRILFEKH